MSNPSESPRSGIERSPNVKRSEWDVRYSGRWIYAGPPHGNYRSVRYGPYDISCECDDCSLYNDWVSVAKELDDRPREVDFPVEDTGRCPTCGKPDVWKGRQHEGQPCPECRYGD